MVHFSPQDEDFLDSSLWFSPEETDKLVKDELSTLRSMFVASREWDKVPPEDEFNKKGSPNGKRPRFTKIL